MSCTLLEKLAAETRVRIYEYVLTFDTRVKHVQKMQPFLGKLSGPGRKSELRGNAANFSEPSNADGFLRRIDTSILTTCKLVYKKAIEVFYTSNIIIFEAQLCRRKDITHPRGTDLSLATQVVIKIDPFRHLRPDDFWDFALHMIPKLFPNLRTGTIYVHTDSAQHFIAEFRTLRSTLYRNAISFDTPGSMVATFHDGEPCVKVIMQSKDAMQRWTSPTVYIPPGLATLRNASANLLYRETRVNRDPNSNRYAKFA